MEYNMLSSSNSACMWKTSSGLTMNPEEDHGEEHVVSPSVSLESDDDDIYDTCTEVSDNHRKTQIRYVTIVMSSRYLPAVLWIQNYFFRIRIRLFRKFWIRIRLRIRFRIRPNLSVRRQFFLCLCILDHPGLIFNPINLKISQLIGLIVVYNH